MGTVAIFSSLPPAQFEAMKLAKEYTSKAYETEYAYIDKAWRIIPYILVGSLKATDNILLELLDPKG